MAKIQEKQRMRARLSDIKPHLPHNWRELFLKAYPQYATYRGCNKIDNVARGISTDPVLLGFLEELVKDKLPENFQ